MDRIEFLREEDFEPREYLVLNYAREWVLSGGKPEGGMTDRYMEAFTRKERAYHVKLIRWMDFFNRFRMTFGGSPYTKAGASCSIDKKQNKG